MKIETDTEDKLQNALSLMQVTRSLLSEVDVKEEFEHRIVYAMDLIVAAEGYINNTINEVD